MKIRVSEAAGPVLDWLVANGEGLLDKWGVCAPIGFKPSTNWAQGGPIIERERISIRQWTNVPIVHAYMPQDDAPWASDGTSPLIAAMRCYVSSRLGDEVEVPEELTCSPAPKND